MPEAQFQQPRGHNCPNVELIFNQPKKISIISLTIYEIKLFVDIDDNLVSVTIMTDSDDHYSDLVGFE